MWYLIIGLGFLLFTIGEIRKGNADLLFWVGEVGLDVTRDRNPMLFWSTMVGQVVLSLGMTAWGLYGLMS